MREAGQSPDVEAALLENVPFVVFMGYLPQF
jgi:hypothetical protein